MALRQARVDLAACFRMAARLGFEEGICNHFSAMVPGRDDLFLVNPYGLAFSEITASSLLVCDFDGHVIEGEGRPEATAFYIHGRLHQRLPRGPGGVPHAHAECDGAEHGRRRAVGLGRADGTEILRADGSGRGI